MQHPVHQLDPLLQPRDAQPGTGTGQGGIGPAGRRRVPDRELHLGPGRTAPHDHPRYQPDLDALAAASTRIIVAAGKESEGEMAARAADRRCRCQSVLGKVTTGLFLNVQAIGRQQRRL